MEHCSYKNSRPELKKFPREAPFILVKAGEENAGIVDIGDGWAIAFKIESHNHPSAVEPFQGAATGVGGIIRDIFTMGARPILGFNSLRFGPIEWRDEGGGMRDEGNVQSARTAVFLPAWWRGSRIMATASAFRRLAAKCISTNRTTATRS